MAAPFACIDADALRHNLAAVRHAAPGARVMAVIKANAYGHGVAIVTPALADADALGVARVDEGAAVRALGYRRPVVVLEGAGDGNELAIADRYGLDLVVHHERQIAALAAWRGTRPFAVWLKMDTGMHRLGFLPEEYPGARDRLRSLPQVAAPLIQMTHFASADLEDSPQTRQQLALFDRGMQDDHDAVSIANSAGLLAWPGSRRDWLRPGIMLYGISPFADRQGSQLGLRPAMRFGSRLIATRRIRAGATVGYCATWRAPRATVIGTAAIGYGDGYPGNLPAGTPVLVNGRRLPLVGRVSMDMITIDLGDDPAGRVGDEVTVWGGGLPVEEIAGLAGRLTYELVCAVSRRVRRTARATAAMS